MADLLLTIALPVLHRSSATRIHETRPHGSCKEFDLAIPASAPGAIFSIPKVDSDIDAIAWALDQDTWSSPYPPQRVLQNITLSGTYNIHVQFCSPSTGGETLQIATHGVHYDSRYWDVPLEGHSYINADLETGYSILTYDRLGTGQSDKPDAYSGVQAYLEVVHVGHSFGSFLTGAFVGTYPALSDAAILTGYVSNAHLGAVGVSSWAVQYAHDRPSGYIVASKPGIQTIFFAGNFTPKLLDLGDSLKQPAPIGELASAYTVLAATGPDFAGPVQCMLAERDFFVCGGDCKGVADLAALKGIFPKAGEVSVYVQPKTGHGLTLHRNATAGFDVSFEFLKRNGL